jgi:hypothetical protein
MAIDRRIKLEFVCWALTFALTASFAASASAEEAASQPSGDAKAANSETQSPGSSAAGENKAPDSGAANSEDIDTRITVQPHAPPGKAGKLGGTTNPIQPLKMINPHRRTFSPSRAASRVSPNASGILNGQRQILQRGQGEHFESNGVRLTPKVGTLTGAGNANVSLATPGGTLSREPLFHAPAISPLAAGIKNHMGVSVGGPASNRHAVGASTIGIGGPARMVNGINGTSIRESR